MARSTRPLVSVAALALLAGAQTACASIEAQPRYATRIEDILPSEQSAPEPPRARPPAEAERPPVEFDDPPEAENLPPVRSSPIETEALPPLAQNDRSAPQPPSEPARQVEPTRPAREPGERPAAASGEGLQYTVQGGDTLSGIGRRFGTPVQTLIELNGLTPQGAVRAGQRLTLPPTAVDRGVDPYAVGPAPRAVRPAPGVGLEGQRQASRPSASGVRTSAPPPPPAGDPAIRNQPAPAGPAARPVAAPPAAAPTGAQSGRGKFIWPVRGEVISAFGSVATGLRNDGINIAAPLGTPVKAAAMGDVVYAGSAVPGFGNLVLIKHADGWVTAYGHLDTIKVKMRERVGQGAQIGTVGATGGVGQSQLHFEIRYAASPTVKASPVDPTPILP